MGKYLNLLTFRVKEKEKLFLKEAITYMIIEANHHYATVELAVCLWQRKNKWSGTCASFHITHVQW